MKENSLAFKDGSIKFAVEQNVMGDLTMGSLPLFVTSAEEAVAGIAEDATNAVDIPRTNSWGPDFTWNFLDVRFAVYTSRRFRANSYNDL